MRVNERLFWGSACGNAARDYDAVRPGYPICLIDAVIHRAGLDRQSTVLEIGCGTGQATVAFASLGCAMLCLEPAPALAALAAQNMARFPRVQVRTETFEHADLEPECCDLVLAATAFHGSIRQSAVPRWRAQVRWQKRFARQEYLTLLNTFSLHRRLPEERRNRLFTAIGELIDAEYGGYVEQPYLTRLCLARKSGQIQSAIEDAINGGLHYAVLVRM